MGSLARTLSPSGAPRDILKGAAPEPGHGDDEPDGRELQTGG